jgi:hypothetical protein
VIKALLEFKAKLIAILKKGWETIKLILADPIGFLGNLIAALKLGFQNVRVHGVDYAGAISDGVLRLRSAA